MIVNVQRDGRWTKPLTTGLVGYSTQQAISSATALMNGPTSVHTDSAHVQSDHTATVTCAAGSQVCVGVYMQPPEGDNVPFRIKASSPSVFSLMIGYAPASITGSDDIIDEPYYIPGIYEMNELIMVPHLDSGDGNYGRALAIGVAIQPTSALTAAMVLTQLSVQSLGVKPPTMLNAIS